MQASKPSPPVLLLLKGHPGSGKSTLAHSLARALRWPLVDKDDIRDALEPLTPQVPAAQLNVISYEAMWAVTERQLALGSSVVVDSPLARPELYERACALALQHKASVVVVECLTSDEHVWRARIESRGAEAAAAARPGHKPATWENLQQLLVGYEQCYEWPAVYAPEHFLQLDSTSATPCQLTGQVTQFLKGCGLIAP